MTHLHIPDEIKPLFDIASITTVLATLVSILPAISALLSVIWLGIRIWETDTVKGWWKRDLND